jgi:hypothetical protein
MAIRVIVRRWVEWLMLSRMPVWYLMGDHCLYVSYRKRRVGIEEECKDWTDTYEWSPGFLLNHLNDVERCTRLDDRLDLRVACACLEDCMW